MGDQKFWLFKSEPKAYSFQDLLREKDQTAEWDGVRNYQARNFLRNEMKIGDGVLFYHSSSDPLAIVGLARVVREGYPDFTAFDETSIHYDPKSTENSPIWYMVDIKAEKEIIEPVTRELLKRTNGLEGMMLLQRGSRLSIQPVTSEQWEIINKMVFQQGSEK